MAESDFKPDNFWEAIYDRPLEKIELAEIDARAKAFIKLMLEEQLLEKRRELQVEIYKIDCELEDLAKNIFPVVDLSRFFVNQYIKINGIFYFLIMMLDGYSRYPFQQISPKRL